MAGAYKANHPNRGLTGGKPWDASDASASRSNCKPKGWISNGQSCLHTGKAVQTSVATKTTQKPQEVGSSNRTNCLGFQKSSKPGGHLTITEEMGPDGTYLVSPLLGFTLHSPSKPSSPPKEQKKIRFVKKPLSLTRKGGGKNQNPRKKHSLPRFAPKAGTIAEEAETRKNPP